jgi:shikimate kinase
MTNEKKQTRRIVLTGFMGSGKSTVGPLLAARLGWRFVDVDDVIEAEAGTKIAELFARHGEAAFRQRELEAIAKLVEAEELVLALGGGAIETELNRTLLLGSAGTLLVHLDVELETTLKRCAGTEETRPILADRANLATRYEKRLPLYREAHLSIRVDGLTPEEAVEAIVGGAGELAFVRTGLLVLLAAAFAFFRLSPQYQKQISIGPLNAIVAANRDHQQRKHKEILSLPAGCADVG